MIDIGRALKEQREWAGLSQNELAQKTGLKQQNISRWESNKHIPNVRDCMVLAAFYGISLDVLVGLEGADGKRQAP